MHEKNCNVIVNEEKKRVKGMESELVDNNPKRITLKTFVSVVLPIISLIIVLGGMISSFGQELFVLKLRMVFGIDLHVYENTTTFIQVIKHVVLTIIVLSYGIWLIIPVYRNMIYQTILTITKGRFLLIRKGFYKTEAILIEIGINLLGLVYLYMFAHYNLNELIGGNNTILVIVRIILYILIFLIIIIRSLSLFFMKCNIKNPKEEKNDENQEKKKRSLSSFIKLASDSFIAIVFAVFALSLYFSFIIGIVKWSSDTSFKNFTGERIVMISDKGEDEEYLVIHQRNNNVYVFPVTAEENSDTITFIKSGDTNDQTKIQRSKYRVLDISEIEFTGDILNMVEKEEKDK